MHAKYRNSNKKPLQIKNNKKTKMNHVIAERNKNAPWKERM